MFAKDREECAKEAGETYLKYIQSNKKRLWADRDILQQLLKEKYITEKDLDVLLEEAGKRQDMEAAMLLEYQEKKISQEVAKKWFKLQGPLQHLVCFRRPVFHDVGDAAVQYAAEVV